ncbi:MAG: peptide ABC transporter permease [Mycobacteriales bacterium]
MLLAFAEIRRARWRFALLVGAVGLLVFLILFVQALTGALIGQFIGAIDHQSADVLVYSQQARKNLEGSAVAPTAVAKVAQVPGVAVAGPLGEGTFSVRADGKLRDAVLIGYEPGKPGAPTTSISGRLPRSSFEAVASSRNASAGFAIGDRVVLVRGGRPITIVGQARDINYSVLPTMFTTFDTYAMARRDANPSASGVWPSAVAVAVAPGASPAGVRDAINRSVPGVEALTRAQAVRESPGVASVSESLGAVVFLCFFVVVVVAGLFFLILTVQKASALTLLRAIGIGGGALVRSLLVQVVLVVLGGVVLGAALTTGALGASNASLGASLGAAQLFQTAAIVLVLATIASLGAIRRVLRIEPIRATIPGGVE